MSLFTTPPKDTKESYQEDTKIRLKNIKTRITALERKADELKADIRVRYDQKLGQIRGQYAQSKEKLNDLMDSSREDWEASRTDLDKAIDVLEESIDIISRRLPTKSEE
jgi:hypothetical protein